MLEHLPDDELHHRVWAALVERDAEYSLDTLPEPLVTYWTTLRVDHEVDNGGFLQLFHNSSRNIVGEAADAYARLHLEDHLALLRRAMEIHARADVQAEIERIWSADDNLAEFSRVAGLGHFDDLDEGWYALPSPFHATIGHLRRHISEAEAALGLT